ncbi:MAG: VWA domain-containing protein [Corynebacterium sp.]|nr:VWA domain-containing protein [Corynebacterium sp.]
MIGPGTEPGIHLLGTISAAANRGAQIKDGHLQLRASDLTGTRKQSQPRNLIIFLVDASGSMAARDRLQAVTGTITSLLAEAYTKRDHVAVISVRGAKPTTILEPTSSIDLAIGALAQARTGGKTPLCAGMVLADHVARRAVNKDGAVNPIIVLVTDGRATDGSLKEAAPVLADWPCIVVDSERGGRVRLGLAKELAAQIGATCVNLTELSSGLIRGTLIAN